jgi:hypothetical protein
VPQAYTRQLLGITDAHVMSTKLREMALSLLNELKDLPKKVTNPRWLDELENGDGDSVSTGEQDEG